MQVVILMPKKSNYWIQRALERSRADIRSADEVVKTINDAFYNCLKEIEKEISVLYYRYAEDNEIDYDLATKLLTGDEYKSFRMGLEEYMDLIDSPEIQLELNTLSTRSRISHLEETFFNIQKQIDKAYIYQYEAVESLMKESLQTNYHRVIFDIGVATGETVIKDFHRLTIGEIVKEFERPWSGKNFSERIWKNRAKLKDALEEEIVKMAISGADCTRAIESVAKKMDVSKRAAATLVHTEQAYFSSLGTLKAYSEMSVDKYIYVATLDLRTSDVCRDLDHEVFSIKDAQAGVNYPPMHPRCRSTTAPYTGALEGTRTARDMFNNEVKVDKSLNYKEWHKKYVESDPKYLIEEKKWNNRHNDKKQYNKYKKDGIKVPKSFDKYQEMKYNNSKKADKIKDVPKTLSNFESHSKNWYESNLKNKISTSDKKIVEKTLDDIVRTSEYSIRIKSKDLESLVTDNRFKNQFETNTSGGTVSKDYRKEATTQLFGANTKKLKKSDYEKYGYLGNKDYLKDFDHNKTWGGTDQYGDVIFRFDKKALKGRVTMTVNNSLGNAVNKRVIASSTEKANIGCIELNSINEYTDLIKNNKFNSVEDLVNKIDVRYIELQYHGKLTLGEVKEVCFTQDVPEKSLIEALKGHNIKAYKIEGDRCVEI